MSQPPVLRRVDRNALEKEPYLIWNAFVDLIALTDYEDLNEIQRVAHLAFWYESEVQNGGHLQYFENRRLTHLNETLVALKTLGAHCHHQVLQTVSQHILSNPRIKALTIEEYVARALEDEYHKHDAAYAKCQPDMNEYLEAYLRENIIEFVELV